MTERDKDERIQELLLANNHEVHKRRELTKMLRSCRDLFKQYGDHHAAKPDMEKAERNYAMVRSIESLLAFSGCSDLFSGCSALALRDYRQNAVAGWCHAAFGAEHATSLPQRGVRLLEEAIEAYQAADGEIEMAHRLVDFVFGRPKGELAQELGGIGITLLALAEAAGLSAEDEETREFNRVLSIPISHFTKRNQAKNAAGFNVATKTSCDGR